MLPYNKPYTTKMLTHLITKHPGISTKELWDKSFTWFPSCNEFIDCLSKLAYDKKIEQVFERLFIVSNKEENLL